MSANASASTFAAASDLQLACEATDIIQGKVLDVRSAWDDEHVAIWSTATVQIQGKVKGNMIGGGVVEVKEVGGTVDDINITAIGFPTFTKGEDVVMLLRPWEDNSSTYRVWGYGRGMYSIARDRRQAAVANRFDTRETGKATMFTDQIPAIVPLDRLNRELSALIKNCK